ncbi:MAG: glycosyl transferase, group 1 [Polaromonas sp.]|nr:glycosyl transferase, group 1 [Polaromonas sp.]
MESEAKTIVLVSPAMAASNNGNWHTAHRWAGFLSGHCDIALVGHWPEKPSPDHGLPTPRPPPAMMIALHARRSAASIRAWAEAHPGKPLVVVLTGTDLYRDIHTDADAQQSLALASTLVVLQDAGLAALPPAWRHKVQVIYQSAAALPPLRKPARSFKAVMVGHLRDEKDPLAFMAAARMAPAAMRFEQIGAALEARFAAAARATAQQLPGYRWLGNLPQAVAREHIQRAHVLVNCSRMEGGAQVILEAVQSGTPVLASRISGNVGMLGEDYAGTFAAGDSAALAGLLRRCAAEPGFLALLQRQCRARAPLFDPAEEKRGVINLALAAGVAASRG